ncbi:hypothetical protein HMPREF1124_1020 [Streptococcus infantis X]|uniref:Uncharacterized protein n=1 Tax=Streptococcus infantis X TaxID=997830 RepID=F9PB02_9STRE|nr:hypothetical protein HMPREF1124_1020 [Streptococcus infantis X]
MSENSNEEKLSFKEQILRDLERLKKRQMKLNKRMTFFLTLVKTLLKQLQKKRNQVFRKRS